MKARILSLAIATVVLAGPPAGATFPGENGKIVMLGVQLGDETSECLHDDPYELYTMNPDGTEIQEFLNVDGYPDKPTWSSDGARIAFGIDEGDDGWGIYTVAADGSDLQLVIDEEADEGGASWSPDGERLAYNRGWRRRGGENIFTIKTDGTRKRQLTSHRADDLMPAWSPDGRRIAFASTRRGGSFDIFTMNTRGTDMKRITRNITVQVKRNGDKVYGSIYHLSWSPDGRWLMLNANKGEGAATIYKVRRNGTDLKALEEGMSPAWSPDGTKIIFKEASQSRACTPELMEMRPNGREVRVIETPHDIDIWHFDWQAL